MQVLILINSWDAAGEAIVQASGCEALAISSASLAWANGYADGSALPREVLLSAISRILRVSKIPLTVDIEDGYSQSPDEVADLVVNLTKLGVVGVNIEDGHDAPELLVEKILVIRNRLGMDAVFINARTDVYLRSLVDPDKRLSDSIESLNKYIANGADDAFVPAMTSPMDIAAVSSSVQAPFNTMVSRDFGNLQDVVDAGAR